MMYVRTGILGKYEQRIICIHDNLSSEEGEEE